MNCPLFIIISLSGKEDVNVKSLRTDGQTNRWTTDDGQHAISFVQVSKKETGPIRLKIKLLGNNTFAIILAFKVKRDLCLITTPLTCYVVQITQEPRCGYDGIQSNPQIERWLMMTTNHLSAKLTMLSK